MTLTFTQVLEVSDGVQTISSTKSARLIAKEVVERINSTLTTYDTSKEPIKERVTPPHRLDKMIDHMSQMLCDFMCKEYLCITHRATSALII